MIDEQSSATPEQAQTREASNGSPRTRKNLLRGGVAVSGTILLVLGSGGAALAATNPLSGLLGGGGSSVQEQVDAGAAHLGVTLNSSGSPSVPALPGLPAAGDVVTTVVNAAGDIVTTVTNAAGQVVDVVTTTANDLFANLTAGLPSGNPGGTGGSSGGGISIGSETGTGSGGGTGSGLISDPNGTVAVGLGDSFGGATVQSGVGTGTSANARIGAAAGQGKATDTIAVSAAETARPGGIAGSDGPPWELALIAFGVLSATGAANIYALRRTHRTRWMLTS